MLQSIITQFLSGFSVVAILVIAALGLAIIFGVAGVINMAHGEMVMVGAYTAAVVGKLGGNAFVAIPVAFIVVGLLGLIIERGIIRWIYDRPLETLLATWGVGILLQTGLGLKISRLILDLGLGNLVLTLVVSAIVLWVLGLSLPITATYLVAVPTVVPALITLGVAPPAAHMFVFYYAVLSEVSPPVALSPFAAAAITGGNPYKTMMLTWKYALPCFLVPFMFTQPDGLAILWTGSTVPDAILASVSAAAGIIALVAGVGGFLLGPTALLERVLLITGGLLLLAPGITADVVGLALFGVAGASQLLRGARRPATEAA